MKQTPSVLCESEVTLFYMETKFTIPKNCLDFLKETVTVSFRFTLMFTPLRNYINNSMKYL